MLDVRVSGTAITQVYPGSVPTAVAGTYFLLESTIDGRAGNTEDTRLVRLCESRVVENLIASALKASRAPAYIHARARVTDQSPIRLRRHRRYLVLLVLQVF